MQKAGLHSLAVILLSSFFLMDAVMKLLDNTKETWILTHKMRQIETSLYNNFEFLHESLLMACFGGLAGYASLI